MALACRGPNQPQLHSAAHRPKEGRTLRAQDRTIDEWFSALKAGRIRLPRWQRFEAWGPGEVASLLEAILHGLPVGATLTLDVGDQELFKSRTLAGVEDRGQRCTEHLLDGQQRVTALWKSLHDLYEDRTYLLWFDDDEERGEGHSISRVYGQARWMRNGQRYPLWVDRPRDCFQRGYYPVRLLRPQDDGESDLRAWCNEVAQSDPAKILSIDDDLRPLRTRLVHHNLPYLALGVETRKETALRVFIKMNTSAVQLTAFDIIVAELEAETGQSLHQLQQDLEREVPNIGSYIRPADLILRAGAMRQDRAPTQASFHRLDLSSMAATWSGLVAGCEWAVRFLESEGILDSDRLPTVAVLPVLVALHDVLPPSTDALGRAERLIRSYVWRSFFTRRYEYAAATRALQDLRGLREAIRSHVDDCEAPIFDDSEDGFPLATLEELKGAGWPKNRDILARAILALSLKRGARDFADNRAVTRQHIRQREYHHLFPNHLLEEDGGLGRAERFRALNCALITWNTNRKISAKEPLQYLRERAERAVLGEEEVKQRLESHLVPFKELAVGGYQGIADPGSRQRKVQSDYDRFLTCRAEMMRTVMMRLCDGDAWPH